MGQRVSLDGQTVKAYTAFDMSWKTTWKQWQFQANVKNLFDKVYAASGFIERNGHFGRAATVYVQAYRLSHCPVPPLGIQASCGRAAHAPRFRYAARSATPAGRRRQSTRCSTDVADEHETHHGCFSVTTGKMDEEVSVRSDPRCVAGGLHHQSAAHFSVPNVGSAARRSTVS